NGSLVIRARGEGQPVPTEVLLTRSAVQGKDACIVTDRKFLARALQLGMRQINVYAADQPVIGTDEKRRFVWQPLDPDTAIKASNGAIRLASTGGEPGAIIPPQTVKA